MEESNTQVLRVRSVDIPVKQDTMLEQISQTDGRCEDVYQVRRSQIDIRGRSQMAQHLMVGGLPGQGRITVSLGVKHDINIKTSQE